MITGIDTAVAWVLDQDAAKKFFSLCQGAPDDLIATPNPQPGQGAGAEAMV
ncbi:hypothetical protein [Nocardia acidivorans]|uniref:hypothetical protein n=1 Tax=Nocardia acidivorans TaxID=404580 RepID=UPI000A6716A7|nr:hypothetical protein [Nocardia acidivorans]